MVIICETKTDYLKVGVPIVTVIIIIASIIVGFVLFSPTTGIQKYDTVEIDYTVWVSDENEQHDVFNPILNTVLWVSVVPITENETSGIILGLYNNLLEKNKYYDSGLIWLNRCVDEARDGEHGHNDDCTNAAIKAIKNAISNNSLTGLTEICGLKEPKDLLKMRVHVKIGASYPENIDKKRVLKAIPFGEKSIDVVKGGLIARDHD